MAGIFFSFPSFPLLFFSAVSFQSVWPFSFSAETCCCIRSPLGSLRAVAYIRAASPCLPRLNLQHQSGTHTPPETARISLDVSRTIYAPSGTHSWDVLTERASLPFSVQHHPPPCGLRCDSPADARLFGASVSLRHQWRHAQRFGACQSHLHRVRHRANQRLMPGELRPRGFGGDACVGLGFCCGRRRPVGDGSLRSEERRVGKECRN